MANQLRRLSYGIIVVLVAVCAIAIYANDLSAIRAADREALRMRATLVRSYLEVVNREVRYATDEIGNRYVSSFPGGEAAGRIAAGKIGVLVGMDDVGDRNTQLRREMQAVVRVEARFNSLTHAASDFGRIYYRSKFGPAYVAPAIPRNFEGAFLDFIKGAADDNTRLRWLLRRADMFDLGDVQTTLWVAAPVSATGGVLFVRIKSGKIRPMLRKVNSAADFYLTYESEPVRLWSNIAKRFSVDQQSSLPPEPANSPRSHPVGKGLRIVQRYPSGEPYFAAARASLAPWLILAAAAGMTGSLVHRALRTEIAERRRAETDVRNAYDEQQKLSARLRSLANEITAVQHRERKRLASLLHDDLQQTLAATRLKLGQAKRQGYDIADADGLLTEAIDTSRNLARQLRPPALYEAGLIPALRWFAEQTRERYSLDLTVDGAETERCERASDGVKELLFKAARELVFNVVKHAEARSAQIHIRSTQKDLRLTVRDWGRGFKTDEQSSSDASGFGLFSVEERLMAIGGKMLIDSAVGRGSSVQMVVPLHYEENQVLEETAIYRADAAGDTAAKVSPQASHAETDCRVLIVDDHAVVRQSIASALQSESRLAVVAEASDGAEAIEVVERCRPDVILMDIEMPGMSGIEAAAHIHERWPGIAIIGLSVQDEAAVAEPLRKAGAAGLISKANDLEEVVARVLSEAG